MHRLFQWVAQTPIKALLIVLWVTVVFSQASPLTLIVENGLFAFLGVIGAIFANATGAGGGVVFVPFFNHLQFSPQNVVATSFAIQCGGMTAGALTWWQYKCTHHQRDDQWAALPSSVMLTVPASLCGVWIAQFGPERLAMLTPFKGGIALIHVGFAVFSVFLAVAIFASIPFLKRVAQRQDISQFDVVALPLISFIGGIITAWLSVGVGELVAVYLIIRGFNVTMAIAAAVILSAFTVWAGIIYHVLVTHGVIWDVVIFAGAGAIVGGMLAKHVVLAFSPQKLKLFFGTWVLLLGVSGLPIF